MAIMEQSMQKNQRDDAQNIIIEGRRKISVSGVCDVDSFDECDIVLQTSLGTLCVKGEGLHINKFNVETGELVIDGDVDEVVYHDEVGFGKKSSLLSKLLG